MHTLLSRHAGRSWPAVIGTTGYMPTHIRGAAPEARAKPPQNQDPHHRNSGTESVTLSRGLPIGQRNTAGTRISTTCQGCVPTARRRSSSPGSRSRAKPSPQSLPTRYVPALVRRRRVHRTGTNHLTIDFTRVHHAPFQQQTGCDVGTGKEVSVKIQSVIGVSAGTSSPGDGF
jgi:hypothetical protein